jgi:hypothetical protein
MKCRILTLALAFLWSSNLIFEKQNCFFIGIPKNATHTVYSIMNGFPPDIEQPVIAKEANNGRCRGIIQFLNYDFKKHGHISYRQWKQYLKLNPHYKDFFTFSVIRNPYERAFSIFRHDWIHSFDPEPDHFKAWANNFYRNLRKPIQKIGLFGPSKDINYMHKWGTQTEYLIDDKKQNISVDFIARLEHLESDWNRFVEINPLWPKFKPNYKINSKEKVNHHSFYDDETEELVYKIFKYDFHLLGYERYEL